MRFVNWLREITIHITAHNSQGNDGFTGKLPVSLAGVVVPVLPHFYFSLRYVNPVVPQTNKAFIAGAICQRLLALLYFAKGYIVLHWQVDGIAQLIIFMVL